MNIKKGMMLTLNQLQFGRDGQIRDKVEIAIQRLKAFEPPDGYFVCFSGGKDSQCVYHLCKMAGVKFDAHYAITSCDPPELVQFIKKNYPDVSRESQHYDDNKPEHYYPDGRPKPITMWSLIADHTLPPTRKVRYCCASLKEPGGQGRVVVTGVRWAESTNRKETHGVVGFQGKPKNTKRIADINGMRLRTLHFAWDNPKDDLEGKFRNFASRFRRKANIGMVYCLTNYEDVSVKEHIERALYRIYSLRDMGYDPYCMIYNKPSAPKEIRDLQRWCNNKIIFKSCKRFEDYKKTGE